MRDRFAGAISADILHALRAERGKPGKDRIATGLSFLQAQGALGVPFVRRATSPESGTPALFKILVSLGRGNLSLARLYEGHVNTLQLVRRFGTPGQLAQVTQSGELTGVWGADDPKAPGKLLHEKNRLILSGRKTYASGADMVAHAVVAVKNCDGATQLLVLDRNSIEGRLDPDWWRPLGMQATNSFALSLDGLPITAGNLLGPAGVYETQPFFGAGAIRFVAAQLGGTLALWDATREHLQTAGRYENPHQAARLGHMMADLEAGYSYVQDAYNKVGAAVAWRSEGGKPSDHLYADCARVVVESLAERVMTIAIRSVGCAGLMDDHPLAAAARDLLVYLRQPAPDAAVTRVGIGACSGTYEALFDAQ